MWIGWLEFDLLLGDVHSLKEKRSVVRPIVAELQRRFAVSAAETGSQDLHRRAGIGLAVAGAAPDPPAAAVVSAASCVPGVNQTYWCGLRAPYSTRATSRK